jgi:hypothetical protein
MIEEGGLVLWCLVAPLLLACYAQHVGVAAFALLVGVVVFLWCCALPSWLAAC